jgi:hypothetical protein
MIVIFIIIGAGPGYGVGEQQGRRPTMEDADIAIPGIQLFLLTIILLILFFRFIFFTTYLITLFFFMLVCCNCSQPRKKNNVDLSVEFGEYCTTPSAFYGVYDGHGGQRAAEFVKNTLHHKIVATEKFKSGDIEGAIKDGYLNTVRC